MKYKLQVTFNDGTSRITYHWFRHVADRKARYAFYRVPECRIVTVWRGTNAVISYPSDEELLRDWFTTVAETVETHKLPEPTNDKHK